MKHWRETHAAIGARLPHLRSYVQNHGVLAGGRFLLPYPGFDIVPELEWDSLTEMDEAIDSAAHSRDSIDDEANFVDVSRSGYGLMSRHLVEGGAAPSSAVKLITLMRKAPNASREALVRALLGEYREIVAESQPIRHELLIGLAEGEGRPPFAFQAVDIIWFREARHALSWTTCDVAHRAAWHLAGVVFGAERLIANPHRIL